MSSVLSVCGQQEVQAKNETAFPAFSLDEWHSSGLLAPFTNYTVCLTTAPPGSVRAGPLQAHFNLILVYLLLHRNTQVLLLRVLLLLHSDGNHEQPDP